ncbi:hypothetical protein GCM10023079_56520 [Streptomyces chitinivorans]
MVASRFQVVVPHRVVRVCQAMVPVSSTSSVGAPTSGVEEAVGLSQGGEAVVVPGEGDRVRQIG